MPRPLLATLALSALWLTTPHPARSTAPVIPEGMTVHDYNQAGLDVLEGLKWLKKAIDGADGEELGAQFAPSFEGVDVVVWEPGPTEAVSDGRFTRWVESAPIGKGRDALIPQLQALRHAYIQLDTFRLKLNDLVAIDTDGSAQSRVRFELIGADMGGERRTDRGYLQIRWVPRGERLAVGDVRLEEGFTLIGPARAFVDVAAARGLSYVGAEDPRFLPPSDALKFQILRHAVGGASTGDVDGDGDDDLLMVGAGAAQLLHNDGRGHFTDGTDQAGLAGITLANAALFADFDNDGDQDLYIARFYGPNQLFANDGRGRFTDVTAASGLAQDDMTAVLAAGDLNGDGLLDLYLGRYLDARTEIPTMVHYSRNGAPNRLYLGRGDLRFQDISARSGADDRGLTLGIGIADYDRDGDQDIYLANDFGRNVLLVNRGDGTFEDAAKARGALAISGGMSASWGDYDGDGWLDMYVSSIQSNQRWFSQAVNIRGYILRLVESNRRDRIQANFLDLRRHLGDRWDELGQLALAGNYLLRNRGDGTFEDTTAPARARPHGWYWSSVFMDGDNDGDLDLLAINGWVTGEKKHDL